MTRLSTGYTFLNIQEHSKYIRENLDYISNKERFKLIAELFKIENADWIFPQAPYLVEKNKYSWSKETSKGKYEVKESIKYLNQFFYFL